MSRTSSIEFIDFLLRLPVVGWTVLWLIVFYLLSPPVSWGRSTTDDILIRNDATVEDLVAYALEESPRVREAFERWRASVERAPQEASLPDPQVNFGYWVARSAERHGMMGRQSISVTQMFPWFGTLDARSGGAEQIAHASAHRLEAETNRVVSGIRKRYAEYYYVESARDILEAHRDLLERLRDVVEARYEAGFADRADILRIGIELDQVVERVRSLDEQRTPVIAELNALLGRRADARLPRPVAWKSHRLDDEDLQMLAQRIDRHPELRARDRDIRQAEEAVRLAGKRSRPDFMVGVEALERRGESTEGRIMLGISLPVWRENYAAARREAQARQRETAAGREGFALELQSRFANAVFGLRDAERWLRLFDESLLPRAEEIVEIVAAAYSEGESTFFDIIRAQREILDIRDARARSLADQSQHLADLQELAGRGTTENERFAVFREQE